jgi:putative Holliday junction resolvase
MPRLLAIDYGTKRVGLAVTDPLQIIASSLGTVHSKDVIKYLKDYTAKEEVGSFVVGKPTRHNGDDTDATPHIEKFISLLSKTFPNIKIERADERFTSVIARRSLTEMGLKKKDRENKENVDQVSAVLILQTYMTTL